jgi:hypothetical protein
LWYTDGKGRLREKEKLRGGRRLNDVKEKRL